MMESIDSNSFNSTHYLNMNQAVNTFSYQENSKIVREKNVQFKHDQMTLSSSSESTITHDRSMSLEGTLGDGYGLLRGLVLNLFKEQGIDYKLDDWAGVGSSLQSQT